MRRKIGHFCQYQRFCPSRPSRKIPAGTRGCSRSSSIQADSKLTKAADDDGCCTAPLLADEDVDDVVDDDVVDDDVVDGAVNDDVVDDVVEDEDVFDEDIIDDGYHTTIACVHYR